MPEKKKKSRNPVNMVSLRRKAETLLKGKAGWLEQLSEKDVRILAHELGTYQIELEIQNENLRNAQEQIESSRLKYFELYDFAPVGYLTFDKNGLILELNLTGAEILGSGKNNLVNKPFSLYIDQKDRGIFHSHCLEVLKANTRKSCELTIITPKKGIFQVELQSIAVEAGNNEKGKIRTILTDITDRLQWVNELKAAKDAAEVADSAKSDFLSNMSHELRTPLNAILGYAQVLKKETNLADNQKNDIEAIRRSGENLLGLINNILDFSKLKVGKMSVSSMPFNLAQFLDAVLETVRNQAQEMKLNLIFMADPELPAAVSGDEASLRQVLLNLLSNAVKFTNSGDIVLFVSGSGKFIDGTVTKYKLHFEIEDSGIGISANNLENIFEPFEQLREMKSITKGTGLGLSISRQLVRLMGSELYVRSSPKGSIFWFDLVLDKADNDLLPEKAEKSPANDGERIKNVNHNIVPPPREILSGLSSLAKTGDIMGIRNWIIKMDAGKGKYSAFTDKIKQMAKNIKLEEMRLFIRQYLGGKK